MNYRIRSAWTTLAILLVVGPFWAHRSYAVVFDPSKTVRLTGTLTKVDWRNPHTAVSLDVQGDRDQTGAWVIEAGPPSFFRGKKVDKSKFTEAIGHNVTVEALRARNGSLLGSLLKITFPDGSSVTSVPGA